MNAQELLDGAESVFEAIGRNTATLHWRREYGLLGAYRRLKQLISDHGMSWLCVAATGSGITEPLLNTWFTDVETLCDL